MVPVLYHALSSRARRFHPFTSGWGALASIRGLSGFAASLCGGRILSAVQNRGNLLFGRTVYGQQLLYAIGFVLLCAALVYNRFAVCGKPRRGNSD